MNCGYHRTNNWSEYEDRSAINGMSISNHFPTRLKDHSERQGRIMVRARSRKGLG